MLYIDNYSPVSRNGYIIYNDDGLHLRTELLDEFYFILFFFEFSYFNSQLNGLH